MRDDETQIVSIPLQLHRSGREIKMRVDGIGPFAAAKPDSRLIKLLIRHAASTLCSSTAMLYRLLNWPSDNV